MSLTDINPNYNDDSISNVDPPKPRLTLVRPICAHCLKAIVADNIYVDPDQPLAVWKGIHLNVTNAEWRLLGLLVSQSPKYVAYQHCYDAIRGQAGFHCGDMHSNVRTCIKRLRQKLKTVDSQFDAIRNFNGFGYRWEGGS